MEDSEADILLSPVFGGVPGCVEGKVCSGMADHLSSSNIPASDLQLGSHAADDVFEGPEKKLEVFLLLIEEILKVIYVIFKMKLS